MPWIISNGKSYVEIIGNNQMITTAYIDRAHTFNNKKTAEKYCSLLPKAMKNLKYKVIFISNTANAKLASGDGAVSAAILLGQTTFGAKALVPTDLLDADGAKVAREKHW